MIHWQQPGAFVYNRRVISFNVCSLKPSSPRDTFLLSFSFQFVGVQASLNLPLKFWLKSFMSLKKLKVYNNSYLIIFYCLNDTNIRRHCTEAEAGYTSNILSLQYLKMVLAMREATLKHLQCNNSDIRWIWTIIFTSCIIFVGGKLV